MASQTGHDMNLANFRTGITACTYFGTGYNPANTLLVLTAMNTLAGDCQSSLNDLRNALPVLKDKMGDRAEAFEETMLMLARIVAAHAASSTNEALKNEVKKFVRQMRGRRAKALPKTPDGEPTEEQISAVNTGYEDRASDFASILATLTTDTEYKTNQDDLKLTALAARVTLLQDANAGVRNAHAPVKNARAARDAAFYLNPVNLVDTALLMKQEVKSTYGTKSAQFKQVSGLKFWRPKR